MALADVVLSETGETLIIKVSRDMTYPELEALQYDLETLLRKYDLDYRVVIVRAEVIS